MLIAIPVSDGKLFSHFGHCETFALIEAADGKIVGRKDEAAPPHEPGLLPPWLAERGVTHVIAGGMGGRARDLCTQQGIETIVGAPCEAPETLVEALLAGSLQPGVNACDH